MQAANATAIEWERLWAPYGEPIYQAVVDQVRANDVVLEIGAGDFRLAYQLADIVHHVFAIEVNPSLASIAQNRSQPHNLSIIQADAYQYSFPPEITVSVLLMRHCRRFDIFTEKLAATACRQIITNARWGHHVEIIDLTAPRLKYSDLSIGWYACLCGATGFIPGPAERLTPVIEQTIFEVTDCPSCSEAENCR